jgi:hypothetical protein
MSIVETSFAKLNSPARGEANLFMRALEAECERVKDADPSLVGGFSVVYDREVPFEIRAADTPGDENAGAYEGLMVKILVQGRQQTPGATGSSGGAGAADGGNVDDVAAQLGGFTSVRVELSSETDLFFHYTCAVNAQGYAMLREDQKLTCDFREFVVSLVRMFNRCIAEPQSLVAVVLLGTDTSATLQIIQNFDYKLVEVLALPFRESPVDLVRCHVEYRYRAIRSRLAIMTSKLHDVAALVKVRDPTLLPILQRGSSGDRSQHA